MDKALPRAVVVALATAVNGEPRREGDVLLLPEDISEDTARALMRMARPRVEPASPEDTRKRLTAYKKARTARLAAEAEARDLAEAEAQAELDAAQTAAEKIIAEAQTVAEQIIATANTEAEQIIAEATKPAAGKKPAANK